MARKTRMKFADIMDRLDIAKEYVIRRLSDLYDSFNFHILDKARSPIVEEDVKNQTVEKPMVFNKKQTVVGDVIAAQNQAPKKSYEQKINYSKEIISNIIDFVFKDEADNMRLVLKGENASWNPKAINVNKDGSIDRGLFQINSNTFYDFKRRYPEEFKRLNINSFDDMDDPLKNAQVAKMILEEQGYKAWYGAPSFLRNKK